MNSDKKFKYECLATSVSSLSAAIRNALDPGDPDNAYYRNTVAPERLASVLNFILDNDLDLAKSLDILYRVLPNQIDSLFGGIQALRSQVSGIDPETLKIPGWEYEIIIHPEESSIEGNALASGDPDEDERCYQTIRDQLASGNEWAWCNVELRCSYAGLSTSTYLGCCSYESEADFKAGGYYADLICEVNQEMHDLVKQVTK